MDSFLKNPIVQICIFGAAVYVLSFLTRKFLETAFSCLKYTAEDAKSKKPYPNAASKWWNEFILYVLPPGWGVACALVMLKTELLPEGFREWRVAVFFGIAMGSICGLLYKGLKKLITDRLGGVDSGTTTNDVAIMGTPAPSPDPAPADPTPGDKP
jgi:hypothetical protein